MFERFTERARQVVILAEGEARQGKSKVIAEEHLLCGLIREEEGLAARVLENLGVKLERAREVAAERYPPGEEATVGQVPFTPEAKKALELSLREALGIGHNYIGTEHLLLGLARLRPELIDGLGTDTQAVREETIRLLSGPGRRGDHITPDGAMPLPPHLARKIEGGTELLKDLATAGYQASMRTFNDRELAPGVTRRGDDDRPDGVRVNLESHPALEGKVLTRLTAIAAVHGFELEVTERHGVTFRPEDGFYAGVVILSEGGAARPRHRPPETEAAS